MSFNYQRDLSVNLGASPVEAITSVTSISIEHGFDTTQGLLPLIELPSATITLRGATFDPVNNSTIRPNAPVLISLSTPYKNPSWGTNKVILFKGWIDEVTVNYDSQGAAEITLSCYNVIKRLMSVKIDSATYIQQPAQTRFGVLRTAAAAVYSDIPGVANYGTARSSMPAKTVDSTTTGEQIQGVLDAEAALMYVDYLLDNISYVNRSALTIPSGAASPNWTNFSTVHNASASHYCINDIDVTFETTNQVNWVDASLTWDPTTHINPNTYAPCKNTTSITKYGVVPENIALDLTRPSGNPNQYLKAWVDDLNLVRPERRVKRVSSTPITSDGYVKGNLVDPSYAFANPLYVTVIRGSYSISEAYFTSKIRHEISPETWTAEYELWRGL